MNFINNTVINGVQLNNIYRIEVKEWLKIDIISILKIILKTILNKKS